MTKLVDLTGKKFGRLTVIKRAENGKNGHTYWLCKCICGNKTTVRSDHLKNGLIRSCGCLEDENRKTMGTTHGLTNTRLHNIWGHIIQRCTNPKCINYHRYGGRNITICDEWKNDFMTFYKWAMDNGYQKILTIDRIDNNKGYFPENCRWTTYKTQANNRRNNHLITYNGKTQTIAQWSREFNISANRIADRLKHGWSIEKALTESLQCTRNQYNLTETNP